MEDNMEKYIYDFIQEMQKSSKKEIRPLQISNTSSNNNRAPTAKLKNKQAPGWKISLLYREMVHIQNAQ